MTASLTTFMWLRELAWRAYPPDRRWDEPGFIDHNADDREALIETARKMDL
jgi:hypothetical protein